MDIRQLRYFVSIAEYGSLSAAADCLHVAQPSLSQHVRRVEEELGIQLLVRSPRGVTLTDSGRLFYEHAKTIVNQMEAAIADVRSHSAQAIGPVSFGFTGSAANALAIPLVETIRLEHPRIVLRAMEAMSGDVQKWLSEGAIDLGILYDINEVRHLLVRPLLTERMYLICASWDWEGPVGPDGFAQTEVSLADCASMDVILPSRSHGLREMIDRASSHLGFKFQSPVELDSLAQMKVLVERGSGRTILPHSAVSQEVQRGALVMVPIVDPDIVRTVYLVKNPERPPTRASIEVEKTCIAIVGELVRKGLWHGELVTERDAA